MRPIPKKAPGKPVKEDAGGFRPCDYVFHGFCYLLDVFSAILYFHILICNILATWRNSSHGTIRVHGCEHPLVPGMSVDDELRGAGSLERHPAISLLDFTRFWVFLIRTGFPLVGFGSGRFSGVDYGPYLMLPKTLSPRKFYGADEKGDCCPLFLFCFFAIRKNRLAPLFTYWNKGAIQKQTVTPGALKSLSQSDELGRGRRVPVQPSLHAEGLPY